MIKLNKIKKEVIFMKYQNLAKYLLRFKNDLNKMLNLIVPARFAKAVYKEEDPHQRDLLIKSRSELLRLFNLEDKIM